MTKELEYIQRQIDIVKQQVKGSKMKIIVTDVVTKHQYDYYERELQTLESIEKSLNRLESIDNANPSEALKELELVENWVRDRELEISNVIEPSLATIKQALLKAQEPKHYLKWEDLEFENYGQYIDVLLNGNKYSLTYYTDEGDNVWIYKEDKNILLLNGKYAEDKQFFNDLHLEVVK